VIGVHTALEAYRSAIAELPASAVFCDTGSGSIVVIGGGRGWPARVVAAAEAGALGVVVVDPELADAEQLAAAIGVARSIPVALDRALLRPDTAGDATGGPEVGRADGWAVGPTGSSGELSSISLLTALSAAPAAQFESTFCDTVGWLRVLSGKSLRLTSATRHSGGMLAMLEPATGTSGCPAVLTARTLTEGAAVPRLRVTALGPVRTEVTATTAAPAVIRSDHEWGTTIAARRFENRHRLALRRVIAAMASGTDTDTDTQDGLVDVAEFAADAALTRAAISPEQ
jgi:hypothetical protein